MTMVGVASGSLWSACRWTRSPGRLAWAEGRWPIVAVPYLSYEPGEFSVCLSHDDSTINIIILIIIIFTLAVIVASVDIMQEAEKKAEEERIRMENIIKGNPLMQSAPDKPADFKVKRRLAITLWFLFNRSIFCRNYFRLARSTKVNFWELMAEQSLRTAGRRFVIIF